jgi:hypothetical protein
MTKKSYREDKKKLKEFFKNEEFNLKKVFDDLLTTIGIKRSLVIRARFVLRDKHGFPGYKTIETVPWSESSGRINYTPSWMPEVFQRGIQLMNYFCMRDLRDYIWVDTPNRLTKLKRELIKYVDKENINDKSVYLYIHKYFLFEDKLYELVTGKSLKEYFLYR